MTAGAGHRRAAETVAHALREAFPQAEVLCEDLLGHVRPGFARAYPAAYYLLVQHLSLLWGACFALLDQGWFYAMVRPLRRTWNRVMARRFLDWLDAQQPDLIVTTHFLPADVCGTAKRLGRLRAPLVVVITDLHPHWFWITREAEATVVGTSTTAQECRARGIPSKRLHVLGIPVAPEFRAAIHRQDVEKSLGLEPSRKTVLVTSGGNTVGPFEPVVRALCRLEDTLPGRLQLVVVCGENQAAAQRLTRDTQACAMPVRVFGFVENMPDLMGASDMIVAKAGGLTVTEAMTRGVPLILYHAIPGQESLNARYLIAHGAAVNAPGAEAAAAAVRRCLEDAGHVQALRDAALSLSRSDSAHAIVASVVSPLLRHDRP